MSDEKSGGLPEVTCGACGEKAVSHFVRDGAVYCHNCFPIVAKVDAIDRCTKHLDRIATVLEQGQKTKEGGPKEETASDFFWGVLEKFWAREDAARKAKEETKEEPKEETHKAIFWDINRGVRIAVVDPFAGPPLPVGSVVGPIEDYLYVVRQARQVTWCSWRYDVEVDVRTGRDVPISNDPTEPSNG